MHAVIVEVLYYATITNHICQPVSMNVTFQVDTLRHKALFEVAFTNIEVRSITWFEQYVNV
jgi:hypothetical protein